MSTRPLRDGLPARFTGLWQTQSPLSAVEWWVVVAVAAAGAVVSPLLDLTQASPDPVAGALDAVFCVALVVAARWPWVGLIVYGVVFAASFSFGEQESVLSAIALSSCVVIRVGALRVIVGLILILLGGIAIVAPSGHAAHGFAVLLGVPLIALISGAIGATLRLALGRERRLAAELVRRAQAEREIRAEERLLISDELHDDIAHDLTVISTYLSVLEREHEEGNDSSTTSLAMTVLGETTRKVLDDLRLIMQQGTAVDGQSVRSLRVAFEDARRELVGAGLDVVIEGDPEDGRVSRLVASTLARTLREAVTNILKHHGQSPIWIALAVDDDDVCFRVTNTLPELRCATKPGFGTIRIAERVESLGGRCIIGADGHSWAVSVRIPRHAAL